MADARSGKSNKDRAGTEAGPRQPRRRTILNLGLPFVPVDDVVNQTEDAVAVGFDVLEKVVEEIKKGYKLAQDYNEKRKKADKDNPPPIPWQDVVKRMESMQDIALSAMRRGNSIALDSVESGMNAARSFADTLAKGRRDVDEKQPTVAGPVFEDPLTVKAVRGSTPAKATWTIRHRGLTRLRIHPQVGLLQQLGKGVTGTLKVKRVEFEPLTSTADVSVLMVDVGPIASAQLPGIYEGLITASNFELLICRLRVEVTTAAAVPTGQRPKAYASPNAKGRTRSR